MPLEKRDSAKPHHVNVTFRVPAEAHATSVDVVGEFTDWGLVSMQSNVDGSHEAVFDLEVGTTYRFRYLIDGRSWENDWAADNYVPNGYGGDDSVVDVRWRGGSLDDHSNDHRSDDDHSNDNHSNDNARTTASSFVGPQRSHAATPAVERTGRGRGSPESRF